MEQYMSRGDFVGRETPLGMNSDTSRPLDFMTFIGFHGEEWLSGCVSGHPWHEITRTAGRTRVRGRKSGRFGGKGAL